VIQNPGSIGSITVILGETLMLASRFQVKIQAFVDFPLFHDFQHKLIKIKHKIPENCLQICRNLLLGFHRFKTETPLISWPNTVVQLCAAVVGLVLAVFVGRCSSKFKLHVVAVLVLFNSSEASRCSCCCCVFNSSRVCSIQTGPLCVVGSLVVGIQLLVFGGSCVVVLSCATSSSFVLCIQFKSNWS
jgi:hypothetical protein